MTPSSPRDLDLYEIAFLAGGPERVVDTALVVLVESGRVRVNAPGELAVVDPARRHPVEAAVLDAVGDRGHRSVDTIRWRLDGDERLAGLGRSLSAAGLLRRSLRPGRRRWSVTRAGRLERRRLTAQPPADRALDGGSALRVALHGRAAMPDAELRTAIFERLRVPVTRGPGVRRRRQEVVYGDPSTAAYRAAATIGTLGGIGGIGGGS